jgi:hypothetical protein
MSYFVHPLGIFARSEFPPAAPVSKELSDRIRIMRVLGIFLVIYTHIAPSIAIENYPSTGSITAFDLLRAFLEFGLAKLTVPSLTIVSGYLLVSTLDSLGFARLLLRRAKTLLVPMVLWCLAMFFVIFLHGVYKHNYHHFEQYISSLGSTLDAFSALTSLPVNQPLYFLRDLFVSSCFSPLIIVLIRRFSLGALLLIAACVFMPWSYLLFIRPDIFLFFTAGIYLRISAVDSAFEMTEKKGRLILLGGLAAIAIKVYFDIHFNSIPEGAGHFIGLCGILLGALSLFVLSGFALRHRLTRRLMVLEPYAFYLFCSHAIVLYITGYLFVGRFGAAARTMAGNLYFLLIPFFCVICAFLSQELCFLLSPPLARLLGGGRAQGYLGQYLKELRGSERPSVR